MALLSRIYYNGVFGALGGLLGWMLFGVFGDKNAPDERVTQQLLAGGALFGLFYVKAVEKGLTDKSLTPYVWGALGLAILGACIGSLSALVQGVLQPASVKVLRGWQEGREYPLLKADNTLGRDEHADI